MLTRCSWRNMAVGFAWRITRTNSKSSPMTESRFRVGRNVAGGFGAHHRGGRPPGRDLREARKRSATTTPMKSARDSRNSPRRVSGYNLDELAPGERFPRRAALQLARRARCVTILEASLNLVPKPKGALVAGAGLSGHLRGLPSTCCRSSNSNRLRWKASTICYLSTSRKKGGKTANLELLPDGKGFLLVEFGGESKDGFGRPGQAMHGKVAGVGPAAGHEALRQRARGKNAVGGARRRPWLDRLGAGPARHVAGLGGFRRAGRKCRPLSPRTSQTVRQVWSQAIHIWPFRPGMHPLPYRI